ncbi:NDP-sugar synthase [Bacteroides sp.]|uniref:nucleotidyltransferase family protein n=1 Tax=Bacteroides sp. TaxID=29523 RepID=UPI001B6EC891|nr:NDP-sugar synthase [Bacteroides sp.]MBP6064959.1 NDP-sugar synthase [Bacteroides sp.]MBP6068072.1 NDP-sugar synthase [Bacteroides sp.]MBP6937070.1 NDP-sugar synthase [Bacteroides sp.]MBP8622989.1 NDP-sugar synthase [Bacteroides sp.]MBP9507577.1 NDP-sugar synthase [Bacteroides sp.]
MKYALIAAGQGSRLVSEGIRTPKPLVKVGGVPLLERLLHVFLANDADSVCIIINEEMTEVRHYLEQQHLPVPLHIVVKSTPDSFHSFYELMPYLQGEGGFCLTTVDPLFCESEFADYIHAFKTNPTEDALMAVTDFVDDERPLYVRTDDRLRITGYASDNYPGSRYISGGIYCLSQRALALLPAAKQAGVSRMRGFQQYLVDAGLSMHAHPFSKIIDIDHASDVEKAERFLAQLTIK